MSANQSSNTATIRIGSVLPIETIGQEPWQYESFIEKNVREALSHIFIMDCQYDEEAQLLTGPTNQIEVIKKRLRNFQTSSGFPITFKTL